jgi:hypothetical protein
MYWRVVQSGQGAGWKGSSVQGFKVERRVEKTVEKRGTPWGGVKTVGGGNGGEGGLANRREGRERREQHKQQQSEKRAQR